MKVNFDFSHVMDSFKDHSCSVCLVKVMNPSIKPVVDVHAPNVILWLRVRVTCSLRRVGVRPRKVDPVLAVGVSS